ncbi:MFS transporter [Sulfobacillus acidophilus]|uniref:MFS transporter n=1 Tax=Sulfobacillus acidophilus TaxID=53633 RepID=A0ABS3AYR8_9FIRM|nr:MFS transporter [Sulfobacillus acidophilus]
MTLQFKTDIPARLDRLPWSKFHFLVVLALGITWILDGWGVTIVSALSGVLKDSQALNLTDMQIGFCGTFYIAGSILGALVFGYMADRLGRKFLFSLTLVIYLIATALSGLSFNFWQFAFCRFLAGCAIGGEYSAINSAVDEFMPARIRGQVNILVNGSYWLGTAMGSFSTIFLLDPKLLPINLGWRLAFFLTVVLGLGILLLRRFVPESPRWLIAHGRVKEAENIVKSIEEKIVKSTKKPLEKVTKFIVMRICKPAKFIDIIAILFKNYKKRTYLSLALLISQAFFYNSIFFTYALILIQFYHIAPTTIGYYLLPFALGNFMGPLLLGRFFDTVGRRKMIFLTYFLSGVILLISGYLFLLGLLTAVQQTILWTIIFFFASAGSSGAYLTVTEIFPLEIRSTAISFFYAIGIGVGGVFGPVIFASLIESQKAVNLFYGYTAAAVAMIAASFVAYVYGIDAERKSLEEIASPLSEVPPAFEVENKVVENLSKAVLQ